MILAGLVPWRESAVTMLMQLGPGENFKNQDFFVKRQLVTTYCYGWLQPPWIGSELFQGPLIKMFCGDVIVWEQAVFVNHRAFQMTLFDWFSTSLWSICWRRYNCCVMFHYTRITQSRTFTNPCAARANVLRRELPQLVCLGTCSGADEETWSTLRFLRRARCASLEVGKNLALRRFSFLLGLSVWLRSSDTWYPIKKLVLLIPNLGFGWPGQSFSRLRKEGHHNRQQKKSSLPGKSCGCCVTPGGSCGPLWVWQRCGFPRLEWSEWRNSELGLHYNGHHSIRRFASHYCDLNRLTCPPTK